MQELINSYSPTDIVCIGRPNTEYSAFNRDLYARTYDYGAASAPYLYLEWNAPGGTGGKSPSMGAKLIAGKMI
jgi:hypothetical protein